MDANYVDLPAFPFAGISAQVKYVDNNAEEIIGQLWQRFIHDNVMSQIPEYTESIACTLYTDYSKEGYTALVGCRVRVEEDIATRLGLTQLEVPAQRYAMFLARGPMPQSVSEAWAKINEMDLLRAYQSDYDVYGPKSQNQELAEVEIFVGVKESN